MHYLAIYVYLSNFYVYKRVVHMEPQQIRADSVFYLNLAETLLFSMCLTVIILIVPLYIGTFHKAD